MSLSERIARTRPNVPTAVDYLLYRETYHGKQAWVAVMFDPTRPNDPVRFMFITRAEAARELWRELGVPYSLPVVLAPYLNAKPESGE